jgi:ligand-binding SRPBCC domain-containing protein
MLHTLEDHLDLPLKLADVFPFFAAAENLERITPQEMSFRIVSPQPIAIAQGTEIDYRLRMFGLPMRWRSKITTWNPPHEFVDEQLQGPYKLWVHRHTFREENGRTLIRDHVDYRLPLEPLGDLAFPIVRMKLQRIFSYRRLAVEKYLLVER